MWHWAPEKRTPVAVISSEYHLNRDATLKYPTHVATTMILGLEVVKADDMFSFAGHQCLQTNLGAALLGD
jgi:hypothetical protein